MKKILLALALFFGLASVGVAAEKQGKKYNVKDLVDRDRCYDEIKIDSDVCYFSDAIMLNVSTFRLAQDYNTKHEEAKKAGNEDEANKLLARANKLFVESAQHMLEACKIWGRISYAGRQFIWDSVVGTTRDGEDKPLWNSQEERILECEKAEEFLGVTR